jgi:hypothetical protein
MTSRVAMGFSRITLLHGVRYVVGFNPQDSSSFGPYGTAFKAVLAAVEIKTKRKIPKRRVGEGNKITM